MCSKSQTQLFSFHVFLKKFFSLYSQVFIFRLELFSCFVVLSEGFLFIVVGSAVSCFVSAPNSRRRTGALIPERTHLRSAERSNFRSTQGRRSWCEDLRLRAVTLPLIGPAYKNKSFEHKQKKTRDSYQCETRHWRSEVTETPKILDGHRTDHRASDRKIIDYWLLMEEQEAAQTSDKSASTSQEVPADSSIQNHLKHFSHRNVLKGFKDKQEVMWQNMSL